MAELINETTIIKLSKEEKDIIGEALSVYISQARNYNDINKPELINRKLDIIDHLLTLF